MRHHRGAHAGGREGVTCSFATTERAALGALAKKLPAMAERLPLALCGFAACVDRYLSLADILPALLGSADPRSWRPSWPIAPMLESVESSVGSGRAVRVFSASTSRDRRKLQCGCAG